MKKLFLYILCSFSLFAIGQSYNNGWIDFSKTYYKFNVGKDGAARITLPTLNALSLASTPAEHFQLWRNGVQVPIYTSVSSGPLPGGGYIEFFGQMNDGKPDTKLYRDQDYQLSDHYSLQTDTSCYFLTVNAAGGNLRLTNFMNDVAGNTLAPDPYFMNTIGNYYRKQLNVGYGLPLGSYVYSSSYDIGEGWTSNDIAPGYGLSGGFDSMNIYPGGPNITLKFAAAGNALNNRNIRVKLYNTIVVDDPMPWFTYLKKTITGIPSSSLISNKFLPITIETTAAEKTDRIVVASVEVTYASTFTFNNKSNHTFELAPTSIGNFLVIDNFNYGGVAPVLLDLTTNSRYVGDITSTPGKVKFALPAYAASKRKFVLMSLDGAVVNNLASSITRNFTDYNLPANQGEYLIISNSILYNNGSGVNNVELYRSYRGSAAGGGYNAKIYDIDELIDQFGYGIKKHPIAVKNFLQLAKDKFSSPKYVFLIGKGITYSDYRLNQSSPYADKLNLVPTFGNPASDILLSSPFNSMIPGIPIGRLSVVSGTEVGNYLSKIKEYEQVQASAVQTLDSKLWMKNIVHVIGGKDSSESDLFKYYMNGYRDIIEDTLYGGKVETFAKSSNASVQLVSGQRIEQLFNEGISMLSYFGHSSANTLEFNLSDPTYYKNQGKYPFFAVSGCTAGNNYIFDPQRILQNNLSISENFVLANQRGAIGFMASSHLGVPPYLNNYDNQFYLQITRENYGNTIGNIMKQVIIKLNGNNYNIDYLSRTHIEEMSLHGDPALRVNPHPKPDYVIEDKSVKVNPQFISVSANSFLLDAKAYNIGEAIADSITFQVRRTYPGGATELVLEKRIPGIRFADSISISLPIISSRDKGLNKITITIDAGNDVNEISESNNTIVKDIFIYEDEAKPAYPYEYAIVNVGNQKLFASTANPVSTVKDYVLEIDTTALFNSPKKVTKNASISGGVLEFDPGFTYTDSTVYYWRVALRPASNDPADFRWNNSSFIYLSKSSPGVNQSHYFQHLNSDTTNITLDSARRWEFGSVKNFITAKNGVFPTGGKNAGDFTVTVNGSEFTKSLCGVSAIIFNVLNPVTMKPWLNQTGPSGLYGSDPVCGNERIANFQFNLLSQAKRDSAVKFMARVPSDYIVVVRNASGTVPSSNTYAADWQNDTLTYGANNSLYHSLKSQGFVLIDSFNRPRSFIFMYQKNNADFVPGIAFTDGIYDKIEVSKDHVTPDSIGYITSPVFGPAVTWKEMHWRGSSIDATPGDNPKVSIFGVDTLGNKKLLATTNLSQNDFDISSIDAKTYPYLQLQMRNADSINMTPYQLGYWRLNYDAAPEGALMPSLFFTSKDSLRQGEVLRFGIAFKNISLPAFDSMKIKLAVIDNNNITHLLNLPRQKPLVSGDTILLRYDLDTKQYSGANILLVDFNPDNDQPEQYHFNNFLYQNFYVDADNYDPTLDVTFDGIHILNRDIVSSRPHILIKLKDESKFQPLDDTSMLKVQIRFPDGTMKSYRFDNDTVRFTPANLASGENTATIDFTPALSGDDEEYELIVSGKDAADNKAGALDYHITFKVISKPMISNMLNYPNPFTTSTAFVFTVTGEVVPQNIRIQILTVTGKIIREVTKDELGPLHIGRNITEFKWDGTDMFGQKVANGVYLYRVLTNLNGNTLEKYTQKDDKTDQYFTKGYGKMYFMR